MFAQITKPRARYWPVEQCWSVTDGKERIVAGRTLDGCLQRFHRAVLNGQTAAKHRSQVGGKGNA